MDDFPAENNESQPTKMSVYVNGKKKLPRDKVVNCQRMSYIFKSVQRLLMIYLHSFTIIGKSV